jgi:hypothetical protein
LRLELHALPGPFTLLCFCKVFSEVPALSSASVKLKAECRIVVPLELEFPVQILLNTYISAAREASCIRIWHLTCFPLLFGERCCQSFDCANSFAPHHWKIHLAPN